MFPLLLLLDRAVECRSKVDSDNSKGPLTVSDSVAEGVLKCLEELLKKCQIGSLDQVYEILLSFCKYAFSEFIGLITVSDKVCYIHITSVCCV